MVGSLQALNPLRLLPADRRLPINRMTVVFTLAIAGLALYVVYSLRQRVTRPAFPFDEGNEAFKKQQFALAISKYTEAIAQASDPKERAKISIQCNSAHLQLRQYDQVLACCNRALNETLDVHQALLQVQMGHAFDMLENRPQALTSYYGAQNIFSLLEQKDDAMRVEIYISHIHRKSWQFEASLKSCNNALLLSKNPVLVSGVHYSRCWTLLDQGNIEEAEQANKIALEQIPSSQVDLKARILILKAMILNRKGEPQQAIDIATEALRLSPNRLIQIDIHLGRALSHYKFNKSMPLDQSLQNYEDAMDLLKTDPNPILRAFILYNKAIVHSKLGQMHNVRICLEEAAKCDFKNQIFGRAFLRFMLEPLMKEEEALSPAQILTQKIQQKQCEFDALVAQAREKENS